VNLSPIFKEIVLVGGGHTHALLIKKWGMKPLPGVRLILISPQVLTPYSGMLPGLIAGHYSSDDINIDLPKLCQWAGVRFIQDKVININQELKTVNLLGRPALYYDLLSLNIGSTPDHSIPGVEEFATAVKPIAEFYQQWQKKNALAEQEKKPQEKIQQNITVVGGGAGSVEIILSMAHFLESNLATQGKTHYKLIYQSKNLLPEYPKAFVKKVEQACKKFDIKCHADFPVIKVDENTLYSGDGGKENFDHLFWCAHASAAKWVASSGFSCNDSGFFRVNSFLQTINNPDVFASGDIAHMDASPRPKAGVYAVRQAPYLYVNLRKRLLGKALVGYKPQNHFLSLLSLGERKAIGLRFPLPTISGDWVWRWKNSIDQKFMQKFSSLPAMNISLPEKADSILIPDIEKQEELDPIKRCGGCGGKIGSQTLSEVLKELTGEYKPEDAISTKWDRADLVQSVDQLKTFLDDPYLFGRITVLHALNDIYAMNAQAHSINIALSLPYSGRNIQKRELRQLLQGVLNACEEESVILLGGHSAEGHEMSLAVTVNGIASNKMFLKQGLQEDDLLIVNKPLGSGLILAALMEQKSQGVDLAAALLWMSRSNKAAAEKLSSMDVSSCTDISGFGLLGHLSEMLERSELLADLYPDKVPVLPGALNLAKNGVRSSLFLQNELALIGDKRWSYLKEQAIWPILVDPQTSGGLIAGIKPHHEKAAVAAGFTVIGKIKKA
jgi:selenide, water dikinase